MTRDLSKLSEAELWKGRKLGELSKEERKEVFRRATAQLKKELESPEFQDAIAKATAVRN